ncbi:MBL fold metallo-hydrolase [Bacillota bacterium]
MKLTVVIDNNTYIDCYYYGEPALCFHIEDEGTEILLDTGYSGLLLDNADKLKINLEKVDTIAISHGHDDHTGGLRYLAEKGLLRGKKIAAHPDAFGAKICDGEMIGSPLGIEQLQDQLGAELILTRDPVKISRNITFLGEIPDYNDFEKRITIGTVIDGWGERPDCVIEDTALAYNTGSGLFIITGCSHSGICNIIEHAKKVCKEERILGVVGGFHLFETSLRLEKTIEYFVKNQMSKLYPCHCVSFAAKAEIHKRIPVCEVGVGLVIEM